MHSPNNPALYFHAPRMPEEVPSGYGIESHRSICQLYHKTFHLSSEKCNYFINSLFFDVAEQH